MSLNYRYLLATLVCIYFLPTRAKIASSDHAIQAICLPHPSGLLIKISVSLNAMKERLSSHYINLRRYLH